MTVLLIACGTSTLKSLLSQAFSVSDVHPRLRKCPPGCTLDCGFKTSESPALRGFVAERCPIRGTSLYLVLKSNGPHCSKNLPVKFGFSSKPIPTNITKKFPSRRCSKPLFIAFFNFSHKWPAFAFTVESEYTLGFRRRIAHSGPHAETGAFPSAGTAWLCAANRIALNAAFATPDSTVLLYTYISRFSVTPHYQQREKSGKTAAINFIPNRFSSQFSTSLTNGPRLLSQTKVDTHSASLKESHTRAHTAKQGAFQLGVLSLPSERSARSRTSPGRVSERQTLPLLGLGPVCSRRTQRAFGTAMRLCVSLFRGVAAPLGCVIFLFLSKLRLVRPALRAFPRVRDEGWYHAPRRAPRAAETPDGRLSKRLICHFLRSADIIGSSGAKCA